MVNVQELPESAKSSVWSYQELKGWLYNSQKILFADQEDINLHLFHHYLLVM